MKRTLSMLLLCALLLSAVACSSKKSDDAGDNTANGTDTASDTETETEDPEAALFRIEKESNGGKTFTILTSDQCNYEFLADELTGELLNDAVYNRNATVGEKYNFKMEELGAESGDPVSDARKAVQAGLSGVEAIKLATFNAARE